MPRELGFDEFGVGMLADGSVPVYTSEQARKLIAERNAEEADNFDIGELDELDKIFKKK